MADPANLDDVRQLHAARKAELIRQYRAEGAGIGKDERGYVIVIYLAASDFVPREPVNIEGVPLRFEVTGKFRPLRGDGSCKGPD